MLYKKTSARQCIDIKKSTGVDDISTRILKLSVQHITPIITKICNKSIKSNIFPQQWKTGIVSPLFLKKVQLQANISIANSLESVGETCF